MLRKELRHARRSGRESREAFFASIRFWSIVFFVLALLYGGWIGSQKVLTIIKTPGRFPIKTIVIEGNLSHVSAENIQSLVQKELTGNFFTLNTSIAHQQILSMPWVAAVSFRREWPSTVSVHITEQIPIAQWGSNGLMNAEGKIFYPDINSIPANLPVFIGQSEQAKTMIDFYRTVSLLSTLLNLTVTQETLSARASWTLQFNNNMTVTLGRDQALSRFKRFVALYPKLIQADTQPITSIDLRYPNGFSVK